MLLCVFVQINIFIYKNIIIFLSKIDYFFKDILNCIFNIVFSSIYIYIYMIFIIIIIILRNVQPNTIIFKIHLNI